MLDWLMARTTILLILVVMFVTPTVACKGKGKSSKKSSPTAETKPPPRAPGESPDGLIVKRFADAMCVCKNIPCAQATSRKYIAWMRDRGRIALGKLQHQKMLEHKLRMNTCLKRALRGNR